MTLAIVKSKIIGVRVGSKDAVWEPLENEIADAKFLNEKQIIVIGKNSGAHFYGKSEGYEFDTTAKMFITTKNLQKDIVITTNQKVIITTTNELSY